MSEWIQNPYDTFYLNLKIVSTFRDIKRINKGFSKLSGDFKNEYRGFLYFLEIVIIQTFKELEYLIADQDLFERIKWGNNTLEDAEFKNYLSTHPEGQYLIKLISIRKKLSGLRENFAENEIQEKITELIDCFQEIDRSLKEKHKIRRKRGSKNNEGLVIVDHIAKNYNWLRFGPIDPNDAFNIEKEVPLYPGDLIFYLMSDRQRRNYFLQDHHIVKNNSGYVGGYKNTLEILYAHFFPSRRTFFEDIFCKVKDWIDLQSCYSQIDDEFDLTGKFKHQLFDLECSSVENNNQKETVETFEELRKELRNREIRCFKEFYRDWCLISQYLWGAVHLCNEGLRRDLEIIQFEVVDNKKYETLSYYAIFNPFGGGLWDGSYWIFFKSPSGYGDPDEMEGLVGELRETYSRQIRFKKFKISEKFLKDYYFEKDAAGKKENNDHELIKTCRGLLSEFLTTFYLLKKYDIKKITNVDCHSDIQNTDIDALIETDELIVIAQVKSFFYLNSDKNREIVESFNKINKKIGESGKKSANILFIMKSEVPDSEINIIVEEKLKTHIEFAITEEEIEIRRQKITEYFAKNGVEVQYLAEMLDQLMKENKYLNLVKSLKKIFPNKEEEEAV
jgi:hypothetical protein